MDASMGRPFPVNTVFAHSPASWGTCGDRQYTPFPKMELCALTESGFLRYTGRAVFQQDDALAKMVLAKAPAMQKLYNEQTGYSLKIFHLEDAVAEFRSQLQVLEQFPL